jgi:hypothetical protein
LTIILFYTSSIKRADANNVHFDTSTLKQLLIDSNPCSRVYVSD